MKISECETIIDEAKFLETHKIRAEENGRIYEPFKERLEKYLQLTVNCKQNESN